MSVNTNLPWFDRVYLNMLLKKVKQIVFIADFNHKVERSYEIYFISYYKTSENLCSNYLWWMEDKSNMIIILVFVT